MAEAKGKVGKREIARAFGIGGGQRIWLKRMLKDLEEEGVVDRRRKGLHRPGTLPPVVLADVTGRDADGELIAEPTEWDTEEHGEAPKILVTTPRKARPGQPVPGVGDRALLRVEPSDEERGPAYIGRVIRVIAKAKAQVLGVFRALPEGGGRLVPVDKKNLGRELIIPPGDEGEARDGDLVAVSVAREGRFGRPKAKVRERLGSLKSERAVSLVAIHTHGIPYVFSSAALREAEEAPPAVLAGREDWRALPLVTIDPADAKDHDDAVHAAADDDPANEGGFVLTVAIADVAAYVRPGSALDREALERGNSVYFPDRVVPMLPERISNDLCSLRPNEDRPALAVRIVIGADGRKKHHSFHRVLMRSAAKLAYPQAQAAIDGRPDEITGPLLEPVLRPLWAAYAALARARDARGPLALDLPERKLLLKEDGTLDRVIVPERLEAHRLIEEFMILANVCAAETLEKARSPLIYRVHDEPSLEKMRSLGEVLASIGLKLPKAGALRPTLFNRILAAVGGSPHQTFVNEVVLRTQAQAEYAHENYGHFGLNLRRYAHFTSPIRRYADLIVHRALVRACKLGTDGLPANMSLEELAEIAARISAAERRAMAAERETVDRLVAHFLADQIGATFTGQISGTTRAGLFIKLDDTGADGFVPAATIGDDFFRYDEGRHALVGSRSGETYRLGDKVTVRLVEAAPVAGALRFELLSQGRRGVPLRGRDRNAKPAREARSRGGGERAPGGKRGAARGTSRSTSWDPLDD
ncbi:ribonuclease R [Chelatococcus sp. SYSU_G07232]|uniref:Ribonuclease R n=1 Tax=Chelatococcus albus TaxID=3047466 RepID=A0ABT7ACU9_9HYPH|nr:ribonuclease R [Chelatococcus sp. SYSU_G07232]MDJ1157197.1 ribonuclease R [Chelatococcus sp. SYSU_G07232]